MYLIIDNYDSFTYNVFQMLGQLTDKEISVVRNNKISVQEIGDMNPDGIIISPGPGRPEDAGVSIDVVKKFAGKIPILGICLGHQVIGQAFGGEIVQAHHIVHGKTDEVQLDGKGLFRNIPSPAVFTRYHSLVLSKQKVPENLTITAWSTDGEIMGIRHNSYQVEGVQFHPESIAGEFGKKILQNFIDYKREPFQYKVMLNKIMNKEDMSRSEAEDFMNELTSGDLSNAQIAGILIALNVKGIVPEEIAGCASVLQQKRTPLNTKGPVLDTCGTGGDGFGTFNISSFAGIVAAACGAKVAKHGNRAVSSLSGSADFYRELGIEIELTPAAAEKVLEQTGFVFLFAPVYHKAMRFAAPPRRELGLKTIMNLLGPLVNPAGAEYQIIGVYSDQFALPMAKAAHMLGVKKAVVVHGLDGLDELSVSSPSRVITVNEDGAVEDTTVDPGNLGIKTYAMEELKGGTAEENARMAWDILNGGGAPAVRDSVLFNAGAGLVAYGMCGSLKEGYEKAKEALDTGKVKKKLQEIIEVSKQMAEE